MFSPVSARVHNAYNNTKKTFKGSKDALVASAAAGVAVVSLFATNAANATLDPSIATAVTGIGSDAQSLGALIMPVVLAILGSLVTYKLVKRFTNKI